MMNFVFKMMNFAAHNPRLTGQARMSKVGISHLN